MFVAREMVERLAPNCRFSTVRWSGIGTDFGDVWLADPVDAVGERRAALKRAGLCDLLRPAAISAGDRGWQVTPERTHMVQGLVVSH